MTNSGTSNRLKSENSTYLKQHANNPIHWWPYSPMAFIKAKEENKPIFLSIGYSSCHWCHVMEKETFNNLEIAEFLNENYISIKVDREELPDLDNYYQKSCQLFTQSGGWPLNVFLLPDSRPFFAGTYFPPITVNEQTGFLDIIKELHRAYTNDYANILENAEQVTKTIEEGLLSSEKVEFEGHFPSPMSIMKAIEQFEDKENGGFGDAPKFPQFPFYEWALEQIIEGMIEKEKAEFIIQSLEKMLMGGILDHAKGGIHRYSVDQKYLVPHFEKMLYDQAGLLKVLSRFSLIYPSPLVYDGLMNTLEYLDSEMMSTDNYFFSSQDSDSEGVEGLYFCYTYEEFEDLLNDAEDSLGSIDKNRDKIIKWFNISEEGNFEKKLNVISLNFEHKEEFYSQEGWELIRKIRQAIIDDRKNRIPPASDTKGVASWHFQVISGIIDVIQYCKIETIRNMAFNLLQKAIEGSYNTFLKAKSGAKVKIQHSTTRPESPVYFEDYVFFTESQIRMYEMTANEVFLDNAKDSYSFIQKEFFIDGNCFTRTKNSLDENYIPNEPVSAFDNSYKSPASTFVTITKRLSVLLEDIEMRDSIKDLQEIITHQCLKNPLSSGEALKSLTYPDTAYRVVKVPRNWVKEKEFIEFLPMFQSRFVFKYHDESDQTWQICKIGACELKGDGIKEFFTTLRPVAS